MRAWLGVVALTRLLPVAVCRLEALRLLPDDDLTELYFIGDLHGDLGCAKEWVAASGLIDVETFEWVGTTSGGLVFMGDYVDKGVESKDVLDFVRRLVESFPDRVAAIMGNHDLFMYLDATLDGGEARRPFGHALGALPYSFFHPEEYVRSSTTPRDDDEEVLDALLGSLLDVYERGLTSKISVPTETCPVPPSSRRRSLFEVAPKFRDDPSFASKVRERLGLWQAEYAAELKTSGLLDFLRRRPFVGVVGDAVVVHGGATRGCFNCTST